MSKSSLISSLQHDEVKLVRALSRRKERTELGLFVIEGIRFIEEAVAAQAPIRKIYFTSLLAKSERGMYLLNSLIKQNVFLQEVTVAVMDKMADTERSQGVLAIMEIPQPVIAGFDKALPFVVVCDKIQDPGNLGTIIRTADAAGVDLVYTTMGTVDLYNPKVLRATMGSIFHVRIIPDLESATILRELAKYGVRPVAASLVAEKSYFELNYRCPTAIWLGNEGAGIDEDILANIAEQVRIPMPGRSESLNVSVAAAILIYECVRQRMPD